MQKKYNFIELFAGCGGMSLGLNAAGFELLFANELSPMAGETYAFNLLSEDLNKKALENEAPEKTLWIRSKFNRNQLQARLRENPLEDKSENFSDLDLNIDLNKKLLIGDINHLLEWLEDKHDLIHGLRNQNITLVSGGPPCQSFSLAGKREKDNHKNSLPLSFAKFAGLIRPKVVLLENVKGITAPFQSDGKKFYAWLEVAKAFALENYVPVCMLLNSKYYGVAQNRPRFILIAIRQDIAEKLIEARFSTILEKSISFFRLVQNNKSKLSEIGLSDLKYFDIETEEDAFNGYLLPKIETPEGEFVSAAEAIGDLKKVNSISTAFLKSRVTYRDKLNSIFPNLTGVVKNWLPNHEIREHSYGVKARFRLYQVINEFQNGNRKNAYDFLLGKELDDLQMSKLFEEFSKHELFFEKENNVGYYKKPEELHEVKELFARISTRKHSQRALKEDEPAPAQLTIPDDICHYEMGQLRTLTVREMARFQSFPDWYCFRSKVTTGGTQRKFEVPQYTQVGNDVPPLLARALGETIKDFLSLIGE